jgi:LysM repeat protein
VESGDTLTKISQKFSSGICNIAAVNDLVSIDYITVGQVLVVPTYVCDPDNTSCLSVSTSDATCVTGVASTYTVVSGDTFFLIASRLGLSTEALEAANPGVDPLLLQVGQVINVPICSSSTTTAAAATATA